MNRTKIEWTDYTWNPVTGCWGPGGTTEKPKRCDYCYAHKMAKRFSLPHDPPKRELFDPYFWSYRLDQPAKIKKPSKIFVCSMGELFGDWVPREWIEAVLAVVRECPQHAFQFLTKNPRRYAEFNPWPENCWVGTTVTNQEDADGRLPWLLQVEAPVRFVSLEPLMGATSLTCLPFGYISNQWEAGTYEGHINALTGHWCPITSFQGRQGRFGKIDWLIIGGMTGHGAAQHQPFSAWVQSLINQCRAAAVPVFLKDNLKWPVKIQEFPK